MLRRAGSFWGPPGPPQPWAWRERAAAPHTRAQGQPLAVPWARPRGLPKPGAFAPPARPAQAWCGLAGGLASAAAQLWAEGPTRGFPSPSSPRSVASVLGAVSPSRAAEQDLAESRRPRLRRPLQAADSGTGTCRGFAPAAGPGQPSRSCPGLGPYSLDRTWACNRGSGRAGQGAVGLGWGSGAVGGPSIAVASSRCAGLRVLAALKEGRAGPAPCACLASTPTHHVPRPQAEEGEQGPGCPISPPGREQRS